MVVKPVDPNRSNCVSHWTSRCSPDVVEACFDDVAVEKTFQY